LHDDYCWARAFAVSLGTTKSSSGTASLCPTDRASPGTEGYLLRSRSPFTTVVESDLDVLDKELEKRGHHFVMPMTATFMCAVSEQANG
jgi:hypothetical protein